MSDTEIKIISNKFQKECHEFDNEMRLKNKKLAYAANFNVYMFNKLAELQFQIDEISKIK